MNNEQIYYRKVFLESGELPKDGDYNGFYKEEPCTITIKNRHVSYIVFTIDRGSVGLPDKYYLKDLFFLKPVDLPDSKHDITDSGVIDWSKRTVYDEKGNVIYNPNDILKQEAVDFVEWIQKNEKIEILNNLVGSPIMLNNKDITISELYDKFKQEKDGK